MLPRTSAGTLLAALLIISTPTLAQPLVERETEIARTEAKALYERAVRAYRAARYRDAVELFQAADRLAPRAALSFDVARAYDQLGDNRASLRYYREYLRRSPAAPNRDVVQLRIGELESRLADEGLQQVTVISEPSPAAVQIDGREMGLTPWTSELPPGKHRVVLTRAGYTPIRHEIDLPKDRALLVQVSLSLITPTDSDPNAPPRIARNPVRVSAEPAPPPEVHAGPSPFGWLALGIGGASLLAAGTFELMRQNAQDKARDEDTSQLRHVELREASDTYQTASRVFLGVGAGAAVLGGALLLVTSGRASKERSIASLSCGPAHCGVGLLTRFQ